MRRQNGEKIRQWRERAGLTQFEVAAALGIRPQSVSGWETGRSDPRPSAVRALDDLLDADGQIRALYGLGEVAPMAELAETLRAVLETVDKLAAEFARHIAEGHDPRRSAPRGRRSVPPNGTE